MTAFAYTGSASVPTFVSSVFNPALALGDAKANDASTTFANNRLRAAGINPRTFMVDYGQISTLTLNPPALDQTGLNARLAEIDAVAGARGSLISNLTDSVSTFLATYFPGIDAQVVSARQALEAMLAGSNFADGRDRSRLRVEVAQIKQLRDAQEKESALIRKYAIRGVQQPSGGLMYELSLLRKEDLHAVADQMYTSDMEEASREAANLERAVAALVDGRARALTMFGEYLARMAIGRIEAATLDTAAQQSGLEQLVESIYQNAAGVNRVARIQLQRVQATYGVTREYLTSLDRLVQEQEHSTGVAAAAYAKMLGGQVAAAYNGLRGIIGTGGTEAFSLT